MTDPRGDFAGDHATATDHWRGIVLFGRNVASYKFALAKSLLELANAGREAASLQELAEPFSRHMCEHIASVDRQGTFAHSKFLDACRFFNAGRINHDELVTATEILGFNNVIDAFHTVGSGPVETRFFVDERSTATNGIRLTDSVMTIADGTNGIELSSEAEARWKLVESAWTSRGEGGQSLVLYDAPREILIPALTEKRRSIVEIRPALNGYQKGHCFYCYRPIVIGPGGGADRSDVDHFLPHSLMARGFPVHLDQVWNLVLSCQICNRGTGGKFAAIPADVYLHRLHARNEYLVASHHPLRETLISHTGANGSKRRTFLKGMYQLAQDLAGQRTGWRSAEEYDSVF